MSGAMKVEDFRPCAACGRGVMHNGLPLLWRLKVERLGIDMQRVRQRHGLEQMLGAASALARVFDPAPELTIPMGEPVTVMMCEDCAQKPQLLHHLVDEAEAEQARRQVAR